VLSINLTYVVVAVVVVGAYVVVVMLRLGHGFRGNILPITGEVAQRKRTRTTS
jgi:hypothetical protein